MNVDTGCSEERVLAYVAGDLTGSEEAELSTHLAECTGCRDQAIDFRALALAVPGCCKDSAVRWTAMPSPFGTIHVAATDCGVVELTWQITDDDRFLDRIEGRFPERPAVRDDVALEPVKREIEEYFDGSRRVFQFGVDLEGLTRFEREVLTAAASIPFGEVVAYAELARRVGAPRAARAVGNALGRNPIPVVVPCHRVVRSDGTLGGYTGGLQYKRHLLAIEGASSGTLQAP